MMMGFHLEAEVLENVLFLHSHMTSFSGKIQLVNLVTQNCVNQILMKPYEVSMMTMVY